MLRLVAVKDGPRFNSEAEKQEPSLLLTFEGPAGEFAHCQITVRMTDRQSDEAQFRDARLVLRDAVSALHAELQSESPIVPPEAS
jgi:hypothetical protein